MSATYRESVEGWRWDYLTPWGWMPASGTPEYYGKDSLPRGWYRVERAVCLMRNHRAPHPDCTCGVHAVEHLTPTIADRIDELDAKRAIAVADGRVPDPEALVITLSRVRLERVLPTAWPDDEEALRSHPDAVPDPPHTIRAHRKTYLEVLVDRDWPSLEGGWPAEVVPEDGVHYVPDLAEWVRNRCGDDLERFLDEVLS
ncbi:hypothetical protein ACQBJO_12910 [Janibacter sp. G349]|uniref:hypothetical protein n=1 Tax=Janibacter sp. G349 TaxID=3405424 RepID=UPI003B822B55